MAVEGVSVVEVTPHICYSVPTSWLCDGNTSVNLCKEEIARDLRSQRHRYQRDAEAASSSRFGGDAARPVRDTFLVGFISAVAGSSGCQQAYETQDHHEEYKV